MASPKTLERRNDDRIRFVGGRAPDGNTDVDAQHVAEPSSADHGVMLSKTDPLGRCRYTIGFELFSFGKPGLRKEPAPMGNYQHERFPGEIELGLGINEALGPFLADVPDGAALIGEYKFAPVGDGGVSIGFRLLFESQPVPAGAAHASAVRTRDELAICLRVLAGWFAFLPVEFEAADRARWTGRRVSVRAESRAFAPVARAGFGVKHDQDGQARLLLPQSASGELIPSEGQQKRTRPLLLEPSNRCCLSAMLRAARGLSTPLAVRIGLRRKVVEPGALVALGALADRLTVGSHGRDDGVPSEHSIPSAGDAARSAIEQLAMQPETMEFFIESDGPVDRSLALLRILGREVIPEFALEVVEPHAPHHSPSRRRSNPKTIDLSQVFTPGGPLPPLLPSPGELEALSFPRHFHNPTVMFPSEGLHLGRAQVGGVVVQVRMAHLDRSRHTYLLGATGTGKSTLLYNMIVQDILAGNGLLAMDPHGDLYEQLLLAVPPERKNDLVLIDPDDDRFCPGLNPLDTGGHASLSEVSKVANDMIDIFNSLYDMKTVGGPGFEDYFRHAMYAAVAAPREGPAKTDGPVPSFKTIGYVLRDRRWRDLCLSRLVEVYGEDDAGQINQFFTSASLTSGEQSWANWVPYILSKLTRFTTNATLKRLFCGRGRTLNLREAMDSRKIVLVNLGKGNLGGSDSRMIGMLLTKYVFQAALSRSDMPRSQRVPFYFYLDEFQNFVATDVPEMLAESRKYGVSMILANQTLGQLRSDQERATLDAVLGNAATKLFLRVGLKDAEEVAAAFAPYFDKEALTLLPDRHVMCRVQLEGQPSLPFVFETLAPAPIPARATQERSRRWAEARLPKPAAALDEASRKVVEAPVPTSAPAARGDDVVAEPADADRREAGTQAQPEVLTEEMKAWMALVSLFRDDADPARNHTEGNYER